MADSVRCPSPQLSIIIPAYNAGKTLQRMLKSIIAQSFDDYEVIVIDDGSSDNTADVFRHEVGSDARFHLICLETNKGVSNARNVGLSQAKGNYIYFCDSDDWLAPQYLAELVAKCSDVDVVLTGAWVAKSGKEWKPFIPWQDADIELIKSVGPIAGGCEGYIWSYFFRKSIIGTERFDSDFCVMEDAEFISRVCLGGLRYGFCEKPLYYYETQGENSALNTMTLEKELIHKQVRGLLEKRTRGHKRADSLLESYAHSCFGVLRRTASNQSLFLSEAKLEKDEFEEMRDLKDWRTRAVLIASKIPRASRFLVKVSNHFVGLEN